MSRPSPVSPLLRLPPMTSVFVALAAIGSSLLVLQVVAAFFGADHDDAHFLHAAEQGLNLFSLRALAAGLAFFGFGGLLGMRSAFGLVLALPLALVLGVTATVAVAWVTRAMLRLDDDGTVRIENAVGATGTVYLGIPGAGHGRGKIHLTLQNRTVELEATTRHPASIPSGAAVLVVEVAGPGIVDVVPDPVQEAVPHLERPRPHVV